MTTENKSPPRLFHALERVISRGAYDGPEINGKRWCGYCQHADVQGHAPDCAFVEGQEALANARRSIGIFHEQLSEAIDYVRDPHCSYRGDIHAPTPEQMNTYELGGRRLLAWLRNNGYQIVRRYDG